MQGGALSRPAGVTVSAIFLILGSVLIALMGVFMLFAHSFVPPTTLQPPFFKAIMVIIAAVFFACALWGVLTAVGLFRMRRWARISILVIGALLVIFCGLSLGMLLAMPLFMPEIESSRGMGMVMGMMITIYLIPIVLGLWWLIYFNRAAVKAEFLQGVVPDEGPRRPLSIAVIAWHLVVFGIMIIPFALFDWPAYLFGIVLTGWAAKLTYLVFGVAQLVIGAGLLKLKPWSHTAAVWYCIFLMVLAVVFAFQPDVAARMADLMQHYPPEFRADTFKLTDSMFWFVAAVNWAILGTALWYLFTRKKAFLEAGKPPQAAA
jgi:hypothetical protein